MVDYFLEQRGRGGSIENYLGSTPNRNGEYELRGLSGSKISQSFSTNENHELVIELKSDSIGWLRDPKQVVIDETDKGRLRITSVSTLRVEVNQTLEVNTTPRISLADAVALGLVDRINQDTYPEIAELSQMEVDLMKIATISKRSAMVDSLLQVLSLYADTPEIYQRVWDKIYNEESAPLDETRRQLMTGIINHY